ncbi:acyl-CoA carboxylase epsilon subunit [Cellulomonas endophytica]|uniref:acyl-CoA carboxylase epsilon subunit n=1 Tax=Cellulomonas endophytica TaxID=2494735 RepID=UPI0013E91E2F|nr:acyl-CoA carboxylase epsilon subunit [Cellulomonas endophytica]
MSEPLAPAGADPSAVPLGRSQVADVPHVQVVRGTPDEVELAALVAGLVAASSAGAAADRAAAPAPAAPRWTDRAAALRRSAVPAPGPDAWRWSARG